MRHSEISPVRTVSPAAATFTLGDVASTLRRHILALIAAAALGAVAGFAVATRIDDTYSTAASLIWDTSVSRIVEPDTGEASALIDPSATSTVVETLPTPAVIERAVELLPPDVYAALMADSGIADYIADATEPGAAAYEMPLMLLYVAQNLTVFNSGRSYVIDVYYDAPDPASSAAVANAVADAYLAYRLDTKRRLYAEMIDSLGGQITTLKDELDAADRIAQTKREEGRLLALRSEALTGQAQRAAVADSAALFASQREAERRAAAAATVYEKLLRNRRELESRLVTPELDVQLFARAVEPLDPSGFNVKPILPVLGAAAGLLLGASLLLLRERLRRGRGTGA